jgi:hypothetical protein
MKNWFLINLGDPMLSAGLLEQAESKILSSYTLAGCPTTMGAFYRHESEGRLHCEVIVYLSPSFSSVARELNANPCAKPAKGGLTMLVGSDDAWLFLFPEGSNE